MQLSSFYFKNNRETDAVCGVNETVAYYCTATHRDKRDAPPPPQPHPLNILPLQKLSRGCEQQLTLVSLDEWIKDTLVTATDK